MPLGVVVTPANANAGCHIQELLAALVVPPPAPLPPPVEPEARSLPTAQADGAYGNRPSRQRAKAAGFRLQAPSRGQRQAGVGKIRQAVERCHNFFAQFGRIGRRLDRSAKRFLGWIELAACVIFLRSGFVR
jgi:transposase